MRFEEGAFEKGKLLTEEAVGVPKGALGTGKIWRKSLFESEGLDLKVVVLTFEPGGQAPLHLEYNDEVFLVHSGTMVTWGKDVERTLSAGEASLTASGQWHGLRNDSDETAVVIVIYNGKTHHPPTLAEEDA